jgi:carbon starvation protein
MHAMPLMVGVLCCLAIAYRYYSAFLAAKVAVLDDRRTTPAHVLNDGQNYHPTHKWVLFGHHFAAISGAGPLIGPVLAVQFGYLPGLLWLLIGVCLAGAVQDMLVLAASVRREGRSLAEIARSEIGPLAGTTASLAILFVVVVALAGLGAVVVKALGGEEIKLAEGTVLETPAGATLTAEYADGRAVIRVPGNTRITYPNGGTLVRGEAFRVAWPDSVTATVSHRGSDGTATPALVIGGVSHGEAAVVGGSQGLAMTLPAGAMQAVAGSSWGTFTIACTVPIALLTGLYMYKVRKGRVVEASAIGATGVLLATVMGNWIPGSPLEPYFALSRGGTIWAICLYGFVASVLPVWVLLCPRDYLSSFLKIGTVALLVLGVLVANPRLEAPPVNQHFASGGGPYFDGPIFPFVFICIMCGAVSGFHALVSSGTSPKMISQESHVRLIGYGAMLIEGLVGIVALIAASALPQGDYWAINIDLSKVQHYADTLERMHADSDNLPEIERQVGGESLRGRTGGAVTLAVGMATILTDAMRRLTGDASRLEAVVKYWYHFAIMFEALFILTTIDTGTRIARFLLQEAMGKLYRPFDRADWLPGAVASTALVTAAWGGLIATGSVETIWPMFGIANQLLAVIALCVVTTVMFNAGRARYAPLTIAPMLFVATSTMSAGYLMVTGPFAGMVRAGLNRPDQALLVRGALNIALSLFMMACVLVILCAAVVKWTGMLRRGGAQHGGARLRRGSASVGSSR